MAILIEIESGASGKALFARYEDILSGFKVIGYRPTGDKIDRARVLGGVMGDGRMELRARFHNRTAMLDELAAFPDGEHDDVVDSLSQAIIHFEKAAAGQGLGTLQTF